MPRLPTREEARAIEEYRLAEVWGDIGTAEDPETFFIGLGTSVNVELSLRSRICIAEALLAYSMDIRLMLDAEALIEAQRLVNGLRRETVDFRRKLADFELAWARAPEAGRPKMRIQAAREIAAIYENARQHQIQFESLSGDATGIPNKRLAEIGDAVWEAMGKIGPPFRFADREGAFGDLDTVLERWAHLTGAQKGQSPASKALLVMIERVLEVWEYASRCSGPGPRRHLSFVKRVLAALPPDIYDARAATDAALPRRVRRIMASR